MSQQLAILLLSVEDLQRTQHEAFATCYSDCHALYCKTFAPYVLIP